MILTELQAGDHITVSNDSVPFTAAKVADIDIKDIGLTTVYGIGLIVDGEQYAIEGTTTSNESTITDVHNTEEWDVRDGELSLS